jgi:hypothetical protein
VLGTSLPDLPSQALKILPQPRRPIRGERPASRVAQHFRDIRSNDDVRKYRAARRILESSRRWMEDSIVPGEELEKLAAFAYAREDEKELATVP